jgi:hypothetical protein
MSEQQLRKIEAEKQRLKAELEKLEKAIPTKEACEQCVGAGSGGGGRGGGVGGVAVAVRGGPQRRGRVWGAQPPPRTGLRGVGVLRMGRPGEEGGTGLCWGGWA